MLIFISALIFAIYSSRKAHKEDHEARTAVLGRWKEISGMVVPRISNANPSQGRNSDGRAGNDRNRNGRDDDMKSESKSSKSASTVSLTYQKKLNGLALSSGSGSYERQHPAVRKSTPLPLSALDEKRRTTTTHHSQQSEANGKGRSLAKSARSGVWGVSDVSGKSEKSGKSRKSEESVVGEQRLKIEMGVEALTRDKLGKMQTRERRERRKEEKNEEGRGGRKRKGERGRGSGEGPGRERERERRQQKEREKGRGS